MTYLQCMPCKREFTVGIYKPELSDQLLYFVT